MTVAEDLGKLLVKYLATTGIAAVSAELDSCSTAEDYGNSYGTVHSFYISYTISGGFKSMVRVDDNPLNFLAYQLLPLEDK